MLGFVYLGTAPAEALEQPRPGAPRRRERARAQSRCATSLNVRSSGPRRPITMRLIAAGSRWVRHATSGPTPSAQATAALIGDTWLTTTTVDVARFVAQVVTRGVHAAREVGERLATRRRERHVRAPLLPDGFGHLRHRHSVELAVVELGPPLVDVDGQAEHLCGLHGSAQRTRHHAVGATDSPRDSPGLLDSEKVERRVPATEEQAGGVRLRPAVTHDDEHGSGRHGQVRTTMRPHGSQ